MSDVYVFFRDAEENDYSSMGLVGALVPTQCIFKEDGNGESILEMSHPFDTWEKYRALEKENIIVANVPVRTTPELDENGTQEATVWKCTVINAGSASLRNLWNDKTKSKKKNKMKGSPLGVGTSDITVVWKDEQNSNGRWKVKTPKGTGWMNQAALRVDEEINTETDERAYEEIASSWVSLPQYFRIFEVEKNLTSIEVKARHISYDLLYSVVYYRNNNEMTLVDLLSHFKNGMADSTLRNRFHFYTDSENKQAGNIFDHTNPIDALIAPDKGICDRFNVKLVRDNYDLYLLNSPGINRGVVLEYGKNITNFTYSDSNDELITCILPVGKDKNDNPLYLDSGIGGITDPLRSGSTGSDVRLLQTLLSRAAYNYTYSKKYDKKAKAYKWVRGKKKIKNFSVNGTYNAATVAAVNNLLKINNVVDGQGNVRTDGICNPSDFELLKQVCNLTDDGHFVKSSNANKFSVLYMSYLDCSSCKIGDKDPAGVKYTAKTARAAMTELALKEFEKGCDEPKIEATVEFVDQGDSEEYSAIKDLEKCYLYDFVTIRNPNIDLDISVEVQSITWDVNLDRMQSMEIGNIHKNVASESVPSWRLDDVDAAKIVGQLSSTQMDAGLAYNVIVSSASGDEVSTSNTTLIAHVYSGAEEIGDSFPDSAFTWYRDGLEYSDPIEHTSHLKTISVRYSDLSAASRFVCELDASRRILSESWLYYLSSSNQEPIGGEWLSEMPEPVEGYYIWRKRVIEYNEYAPEEGEPELYEEGD